MNTANTTQVTYQNRTHVKLVYVLESSPRLNANTLIWSIVLPNRSDLCLFKMNGDNDLFRLDNGLFLRTFVSWSLPWSQPFAHSYTYSLHLEANECYSSNASSTFLHVDVTFSLERFAQMRLTRDDVPVPKLARVNYDLQLTDTTNSSSNSQVMLLKKFDVVLVYDLKRLNDDDDMVTQYYNVTYSLVKKDEEDEDEDEDEELPFFIDPLKGELFYTRSSLSLPAHRHRMYELRVEIKLHFVYNESLSFSLFPSVRVNVTSTTIKNNAKAGASNLMRKDLNDTTTTTMIHGTLDLSLSITSTDLREFLKCPMLGQFRFYPTASTPSSVSYKLLLPRVVNREQQKAKEKTKDQSHQKYAKNVYKYSSKTRKRTSKVRAKVSCL